MNSSAFRAALRASAKVALGVAVGGCGGSVDAASRGPSDAAADASITSDAGFAGDVEHPDAAAAVVDSAANACNAPSASSLLPEPLHPDAGAGFGFTDAAAADPGVMDCCAVVVTRLDDDWRRLESDPDAGQAALDRDQALAATVHWSCCAETNEPEGPTCTPWGPPMPPVMPVAEVA